MNNRDTGDVIIIGTGAGGAAAAHALACAGLRVIILEKGGPLPRDGSTLDVDRVVRRGEFLSREPWLDGSGREFKPEEHFNVGGKTKWYGAALARFAPEEFAADPAHGCRGWPIGYEDLAPYYARAEELLGVRQFDCEPALQRILRRLVRADSAWHSTPLPLALHREISRHTYEAAHFDGFASILDLKGDAECNLLAKIRRLSNVRLETSSEVAQLLPAALDPLRVAGVRLMDGREFYADKVLLAAGALHSPRLLQKFVRDHAPQPLACAAHIGTNLKLHVLTAMVAISPSAKSDLIRKTMLVVHERYPHSSVQALGFDADLIANLIPSIVPRFIAKQVGKRAYGFFLQTEDGSHAANRVIEAEAQGKPTLDYDVARLPAAAAEHRAFTRHLQRSLLQAGMLSFTQRIGLAGTAHACGSLIAGRDPAESVVDADGRVYGLSGLYVVDGSILPRSSRVNPALTIYAWAMRVAEKIAATVQGPRENTTVGGTHERVGA
jgi:choline dehydrogenase-like flavoprotein